MNNIYDFAFVDINEIPSDDARTEILKKVGGWETVENFKKMVYGVNAYEDAVRLIGTVVGTVLSAYIGPAGQLVGQAIGMVGKVTGELIKDSAKPKPMDPTLVNKVILYNGFSKMIDDMAINLVYKVKNLKSKYNFTDQEIIALITDMVTAVIHNEQYYKTYIEPIVAVFTTDYITSATGVPRKQSKKVYIDNRDVLYNKENIKYIKNVITNKVINCFINYYYSDTETRICKNKEEAGLDSIYILYIKELLNKHLYMIKNQLKFVCVHCSTQGLYATTIQAHKGLNTPKRLFRTYYILNKIFLATGDLFGKILLKYPNKLLKKTNIKLTTYYATMGGGVSKSVRNRYNLDVIQLIIYDLLLYHRNNWIWVETEKGKTQKLNRLIGSGLKYSNYIDFIEDENAYKHIRFKDGTGSIGAEYSLSYIQQIIGHNTKGITKDVSIIASTLTDLVWDKFINEVINWDNLIDVLLNTDDGKQLLNLLALGFWQQVYRCKPLKNTIKVISDITDLLINESLKVQRKRYISTKADVVKRTIIDRHSARVRSAKAFLSDIETYKSFDHSYTGRIKDCTIYYIKEYLGNYNILAIRREEIDIDKYNSETRRNRDKIGYTKEKPTLEFLKPYYQSMTGKLVAGLFRTYEPEIGWGIYNYTSKKPYAVNLIIDSIFTKEFTVEKGLLLPINEYDYKVGREGKDYFIYSKPGYDILIPFYHIFGVSPKFFIKGTYYDYFYYVGQYEGTSVWGYLTRCYVDYTRYSMGRLLTKGYIRMKAIINGIKTYKLHILEATGRKTKEGKGYGTGNGEGGSEIEHDLSKYIKAGLIAVGTIGIAYLIKKA